MFAKRSVEGQLRRRPRPDGLAWVFLLKRQHLDGGMPESAFALAVLIRQTVLGDTLIDVRTPGRFRFPNKPNEQPQKACNLGKLPCVNRFRLRPLEQCMDSSLRFPMFSPLRLGKAFAG